MGSGQTTLNTRIFMNTISLQLKASKGVYTVNTGFMQLSIVPDEINKYMHSIAAFIEAIANRFNTSPDKVAMDRIIKNVSAVMSIIDPHDSYTINFSLDENGKLTCSFSGIVSTNLLEMATTIKTLVSEDDNVMEEPDLKNEFTDVESWLDSQPI